MVDILKELPQWFIMLLLIYLAVMLSIAVLRGQEVQFFPPKIGPRPDKGDQNKGDQRNNNDEVNVQQQPSPILGVWGDSFIDHRDQNKLKAAIIRIKFDEGKYKIDGYEYDENLTQTGFWKSIAVEYDGKEKLDYFFKATITPPKSDPEEIRGYTSLTFIGSKDNTFDTYDGYFVNVEKAGRSASFKGYKLPKEDEPKFGTHEGKRVLAKRLIDKERDGDIL